MKYRIWSIEHNAWWKPDRFGYTPDITEAGVYQDKEAFQIVREANSFLHDHANESLVPVFEKDRE